jgi:hypothetical protein
VSHLELVTNTENVRRGLATKLTADVVREIRASSATADALAPVYGVAPSTIRMARCGQTWRDVA